MNIDVNQRRRINKISFIPAIGSRELTHYFLRPHTFHAKQSIIYDQLPKRACEQLKVSPDESQLGWGIHFEEGWHWKTVCFLVVVLVISSLAFGTAWVITTGDIQSGLAITTTGLAVTAIFVGYLAVRDY